MISRKSGDHFTSQKLIITLSQPASTVCSNKDGSKIAIAGRKIFTINDVTNQMSEILNLRNLPQKQLNLNYSSNHVQWNPRDENQLASAPMNSSVLLWDLNKRTKSKLSYVFEDVHQRSVNRVCYHPREPNVLLSGSQDGTMVCFDTRQKVTVSHYTGPDSVRDVQYNPLSDHYFAACFENGSCQIWDRRHPDTSVKQINAHIGPAYSCAWHMEQEHRIVSAGRDKIIKVYDTQQARPKEMHIINALYSVARVKWRPLHKQHLSSCSHLLDSTVAVWDVRRPFIQYATFSEHTDDVTDFIWLSDDVLVSCAKDSKLIQQTMSHAYHQTDRATPVSISFRPDGYIATSCSDQRTKSHVPNTLSRNPIQFRKIETDPYQQTFLCHTSYLHEFVNNEEVWLSNFKYCAKNYLIEGNSIDKLCDHNYKVCMDCNKSDTGLSWLILKLLYCGNDTQCSTLGLLPLEIAKKKEQEQKENKTQLLSEKNNVDNTNSTSDTLSQKDKANAVSEDDPQDITGVLEFFEYNVSDSDSTASGSVSHTQQELELPKEPFQLRQEIGNTLEVPDNYDELSNTSDGGISFISTGRHSSPTVSSHSQKPLPPGLTPPVWDYSPQVIEMLKFYAEKGDVQMSVTVVLVLMEKILKLIPESFLLQWFYSYIDLLTQYQLLNEAAYITKLCPIKEISQSSQNSTLYNIGCGQCNKILPSHASVCQKCETTLNLCSICHMPVKGLYSWCEVCGHGGHTVHMREWFSKCNWCPTGCGHICLT